MYRKLPIVGQYTQASKLAQYTLRLCVRPNLFPTHIHKMLVAPCTKVTLKTSN